MAARGFKFGIDVTGLNVRFINVESGESCIYYVTTNFEDEDMVKLRAELTSLFPTNLGRDNLILVGSIPVQDSFSKLVLLRSAADFQSFAGVKQLGFARVAVIRESFAETSPYSSSAEYYFNNRTQEIPLSPTLRKLLTNPTTTPLDVVYEWKKQFASMMKVWEEILSQLSSVAIDSVKALKEEGEPQATLTKIENMARLGTTSARDLYQIIISNRAELIRIFLARPLALK